MSMIYEYVCMYIYHHQDFIEKVRFWGIPIEITISAWPGTWPVETLFYCNAKNIWIWIGIPSFIITIMLIPLRVRSEAHCKYVYI